MMRTLRSEAARRPARGKTVAEVMTPNPVSIRADATLPRAVAFLVDTGYSAAPVIDEAGRPVGVISRSDVVVYDRERLALPAEAPMYFESADLVAEAVRSEEGGIRVEHLMTPAVFAVGPQTPLEEAARRLVALNVHRLFVVDAGGTLVGVVSVLDLLRHLLPAAVTADADAAE
jgi:CBS domain-containing protein